MAAYFIVGGEVVWSAARNIVRGQVFDENFLMALATIGAFAIGEYPEGVAVMLFYQVGELLVWQLTVPPLHYSADGYPSGICLS